MFLKVYKYANILSIDVVAGACASTWLVADFLKVHLPASVFICLATAVFVIYTSDHLMDARCIRHKAHTRRHLFHQQHYTRLWAIVAIASICGLVFLLRLPGKTIYYGLMISSMVGIYFLSLKIRRLKVIYHKELLVAFIYACGIFLGPLSIWSGDVPTGIFIFFFQFFLIAFINLLMFSYYEKETDEKDGQSSFVMNAGPVWSKKIIWLLVTLGFVSAMVVIIFFYGNPWLLRLQMITIAMLLTLFLIGRYPSYFTKNDKYRLWGDAIFLYPIPFLLIVNL